MRYLELKSADIEIRDGLTFSGTHKNRFLLDLSAPFASDSHFDGVNYRANTLQASYVPVPGTQGYTCGPLNAKLARKQFLRSHIRFSVGPAAPSSTQILI